ncbi:MAG: hypothetical protein AAFY71_19585, partial [Bacteroidota bacterium]
TVQIRMTNFFPKRILTSDSFKGLSKKTSKNRFLRHLKFPKHYREMNAYARRMGKFAERLRLSTIQRAVNFIITDSFAHNYGAHCLVELTWYFENRARQLSRKFRIEGRDEIEPIKYLFPPIFTNKQLRSYGKQSDFHARIGHTHSAFRDDEVSMQDVIRFMDKNIERGFLKFYESE